MTIQDKLKDWAKDTAAAYHKLANENEACNRAFYTQSDLSKLNTYPELLILGINPKGNCKYDYPIDENGYMGQIQNEKWGIPNGMTGENLLKGNPFECDKCNWPIWNPVKILFEKAGALDLLAEGNYAYSNMVLYETPRETDIPEKAWSLLSLTFALIDILQPKYILCLGKKNAMERLIAKNYCEEVLPGMLYKGQYKQSTVLGLPHPSRNAWSKHYEVLAQEVRKIIEQSE
jgi:hypothetical protein